MVTLAEIKTQARQRSDMENTQFISDSELNSYVNASVKELYDLLVAAFDDYYIADAYEVTLAADSHITLPTDFYKLRGVDKSNSTSNWFTLKPFNFLERNKYNNQNLANYALGPNLVNYRVFGSTIKLEPSYNSEGNYRIWYVPKCPALVSDTDSFDGINGWEDYVVVDCAIKMLQKQEDDVSVLMAQKNELKSRIEAMSADRDAGSPETITDARNPNGGLFNW